MDCKDCHRYSFVQQNGPYALLPDGKKPKTRQCAAWQRFDRWRKKPGNSLQFKTWHSTIDLHGPLYAPDKDIRDESVKFMSLSNDERAKGRITMN